MMDNQCLVILELSDDTGIMYDMESECFNNQTYIPLFGDSNKFWGLDFEKVYPSPASLLLEKSLLSQMKFEWESEFELFWDVHYPKRKTKPTVRKVLQTFSRVPGLLPEEFRKPRNLDQVKKLIRTTVVGRKYLFISHLHHRNLAKYGQRGLYHWREKHWGIARPCKNMECIALGCYKLYTHLNCPDGIFRSLSARYPELKINVKYVKYFNREIRSAGSKLWKNGELLKQEILDLNQFILDHYLELDG